MAIAKVLGTETEYGIAAVGVPDFNPVLASSLLISTFAGSLRRIRWDYEQESPLRDARGFEPIPSREVSDEDLGLANVILPIGAQNAFVLGLGLRGEHVLAVAPTCALSDALLILAGVAGFAQVSAVMPWAEPVMRYAGAAFLIAYGACSFRSAFATEASLRSHA